MRLLLVFTFILTTFLGAPGLEAAGFSSNYIELDLTSKRVKFADFSLGNYKIAGDFRFDIETQGDSLIFKTEGENISLGEKIFPWIKIKLVKNGDNINIGYFISPEFTITGKFNLKTQEMSMDITVDSWQKIADFRGNVKGKINLWGAVNNLLAAGRITVENGLYKDVEFSRLFLDFLGNPPMLNLMDSSIILKDGSVYDIEGLINLKNPDSFWREAKFTGRKICLDGWDLYSENRKDAGFKKEIDNKFDVSINTHEGYNDNPESETELRYRVQGDKFFKFRLQEKGTALGFENRKEF